MTEPRKPLAPVRTIPSPVVTVEVKSLSELSRLWCASGCVQTDVSAVQSMGTSWESDDSSILAAMLAKVAGLKEIKHRDIDAKGFSNELSQHDNAQ